MSHVDSSPARAMLAQIPWQLPAAEPAAVPTKRPGATWTCKDATTKALSSGFVRPVAAEAYRQAARLSASSEDMFFGSPHFTPADSNDTWQRTDARLSPRNAMSMCARHEEAAAGSRHHSRRSICLSLQHKSVDGPYACIYVVIVVCMCLCTKMLVDLCIGMIANTHGHANRDLLGHAHGHMYR